MSEKKNKVFWVPIVLKQIFLVLMITASVKSFSQISLADSIRTVLSNHNKVNSIEYDSIFYSSGELMMEGWLYISDFEGIDSQIKHDHTISIRVGTWHRYNRKGRIKEIHLRPLYDSLVTVILYFDRSGHKKAEHRYLTVDEVPVYSQDYRRKGLSLSNRIDYNRIKYYESGKVKYDFNFCGLKFCGHYKHYYENGQLSYSYNHNENGKKHGLYEYYYETGVLRESGVYKNGKKSGLWRKYDSTGELKKEKTRRR